MKKRYIFGLLVFLAIIFFLINIIAGSYFDEKFYKNRGIPRLGQKMWTYNMNKYEWRNYNNNDDEESKSEIILQYKGQEDGNNYTIYRLITGNFQVPKEDLRVGEMSQEFLVGKKLYTYLPRNFEYGQIVFNGVKFTVRILAVDEVAALFKGYNILKLSDIQKGNYTTEFSDDDNKFIILNDKDEDFYKYYIVPNDSKKLEIGEFSNQFKVFDKVSVRIQRLEGCTKAYPCYELKINSDQKQ